MTEYQQPDIESTIVALRSGDVRRCARLITLAERRDIDIVPLLQALYRFGGNHHTVGVTGPPGSGKSTLVNGMIGMWRRRGRRVAVLAIDPSSPFSGGAVLGDRLRMTEHGSDEGVFIRSMASRGQLGGLAKAAGDALTVLCAMPWDVIVIETVGVGQNETDIVRHAAVVLLLQTPMGGDDVQAAKAGITEIADVYVVNKGDHPQADQTVNQLREMVSLGFRLHPDQTWLPPVVKTQACTGEGVSALVDHVEKRFAHFAVHPEVTRQRDRDRVKYRIGEILQDMLDRRIRSDAENWLDKMIDPVLFRESDPYAVAANLLARLSCSHPPGSWVTIRPDS